MGGHAGHPPQPRDDMRNRQGPPLYPLGGASPALGVELSHCVCRGWSGSPTPLWNPCVGGGVTPINVHGSGQASQPCVSRGQGQTSWGHSGKDTRQVVTGRHQGPGSRSVCVWGAGRDPGGGSTRAFPSPTWTGGRRASPDLASSGVACACTPMGSSGRRQRTGPPRAVESAGLTGQVSGLYTPGCS